MATKDVIRQLLTESDNVTHDLYRYMAVASVVSGLALQVFAVGWRGQPFDMQAFGVGTGALLAGVGVALGMKKENS